MRLSRGLGASRSEDFLSRPSRGTRTPVRSGERLGLSAILPAPQHPGLLELCGPSAVTKAKRPLPPPPRKSPDETRQADSLLLLQAAHGLGACWQPRTSELFRNSQHSFILIRTCCLDAAICQSRVSSPQSAAQNRPAPTSSAKGTGPECLKVAILSPVSPPPLRP